MLITRWEHANDGDVVGLKYWNANGSGIAIAAVKGYADDWAAYIGADNGWSESDCAQWTIRHGCKITKEHAAFLFPHLPTEGWRD